MKRNTQYLEAYRRFEAVVRKCGYGSVKEYEESLTNEEQSAQQGKLRMCRLIRNYIEHENGAFVEASDQMIAFIEAEATKLDESETPIKKKMIALKYAIKDTDLIVVAADFITKRNAAVVPVFDKNDFAIGVVSQSGIVGYIASGDFTKAKKVTAILEQHKFGFINEHIPMRQVIPAIEKHDKVYLVLNDSKKVIGWII